MLREVLTRGPCPRCGAVQWKRKGAARVFNTPSLLPDLGPRRAALPEPPAPPSLHSMRQQRGDGDRSSSISWAATVSALARKGPLPCVAAWGQHEMSGKKPAAGRARLEDGVCG